MSNSTHNIQVKVDADLKVLSILTVQTEAQVEAVAKLKKEYEAQAKSANLSAGAQQSLAAGIAACDAALASQSAALVQQQSALRQHVTLMGSLNTPEAAASANQARQQIASIGTALGQSHGPLDRAKEALHEFHDAYKNAGSGVDGLKAALSAGLGTWVAWGLAAGVAAKAGKEAIHEFTALEKAVVRLDAVLAANGKLTEENSERYGHLAEKLSEGGVGGERWLGVLAKLTQHGAPTADIEKYGEAVKNLAALMGRSPEAAAQMLTRAMDGNTRALKRWVAGVTETGDKAKDLAHTLSLINEQGGPVAAALEHTIGGAAGKLRVQISNIMETVGGFLAGLLHIQERTEGAANLAKWFAEKLGDLKRALMELPEGLREVIGLTDKHKQANIETALATDKAKEMEYEHAKKLKETKEATAEATAATKDYVNELNGQIAAQLELVDAEQKLKLAKVDADLKTGKIDKVEAEKQKQAIKADTDNKKFALKYQEKQNKAFEAGEEYKSARAEYEDFVNAKATAGKRMAVTQEIKSARAGGATVTREQGQHIAEQHGLAFDDSLLDADAYAVAEKQRSLYEGGDKKNEAKKLLRAANAAGSKYREASRAVGTAAKVRELTAAADDLGDRTHLNEMQALTALEEEAKGYEAKNKAMDEAVRLRGGSMNAREVAERRFNEQKQKAALVAAAVVKARGGGSRAALEGAKIDQRQNIADVNQANRGTDNPALTISPTEANVPIVQRTSGPLPAVSPTALPGAAPARTVALPAPAPLAPAVAPGAPAGVPVGAPGLPVGSAAAAAPAGRAGVAAGVPVAGVGALPLPVPVEIVAVRAGVTMPVVDVAAQASARNAVAMNAAAVLPGMPGYETRNVPRGTTAAPSGGAVGFPGAPGAPGHGNMTGQASGVTGGTAYSPSQAPVTLPGAGGNPVTVGVPGSTAQSRPGTTQSGAPVATPVPPAPPGAGPSPASPVPASAEPMKDVEAAGDAAAEAARDADDAERKKKSAAGGDGSFDRFKAGLEENASGKAMSGIPLAAKGAQLGFGAAKSGGVALLKGAAQHTVRGVGNMLGLASNVAAGASGSASAVSGGSLAFQMQQAASARAAAAPAASVASNAATLGRQALSVLNAPISKVGMVGVVAGAVLEPMLNYDAYAKKVEADESKTAGDKFGSLFNAPGRDDQGWRNPMDASGPMGGLKATGHNILNAMSIPYRAWGQGVVHANELRKAGNDADAAEERGDELAEVQRLITAKTVSSLNGTDLQLLQKHGYTVATNDKGEMKVTSIAKQQGREQEAKTQIASRAGAVAADEAGLEGAEAGQVQMAQQWNALTPAQQKLSMKMKGERETAAAKASAAAEKKAAFASENQAANDEKKLAYGEKLKSDTEEQLAQLEQERANIEVEGGDTSQIDAQIKAAQKRLSDYNAHLFKTLGNENSPRRMVAEQRRQNSEMLAKEKANAPPESEPGDGTAPEPTEVANKPDAPAAAPASAPPTAQQNWQDFNTGNQAGADPDLPEINPATGLPDGPAPTQVAAFARGGDADAGDPILVGEVGPELWTPRTGGHVSSHDRTRELFGMLGGGEDDGGAEEDSGGGSRDALDSAGKSGEALVQAVTNLSRIVVESNGRAAEVVRAMSAAMAEHGRDMEALRAYVDNSRS